MNVSIKSIAYQLPDKVVDNESLKHQHPEWNMDLVAKKTGVYKRHIAAKGETALDLALAACKTLFGSHPQLGGEVQAIIFCTQTPDHPLPGNACILHRELKLSNDVACFDINLACSGYIYALSMARAFILSGTYKDVLVVTGDTYSKLINHNDRSSIALFGDGASVSWIGESESSSNLEAVKCCTRGVGFDSFCVPAGGKRQPSSEETMKETEDANGNWRSQENIFMDGKKILMFVSSQIPTHIKRFLKESATSLDEIDHFLFHQASLMNCNALIKSLKVDKEKVYMNLDRVGNTVSSSIPIAFSDAISEGKITRGQKVLLCGFGAGLSWGSILLTF